MSLTNVIITFVQIAISIMLIGYGIMTLAFHSESMRGNLNNPVSTSLLLLIWVIIFLPLIFTAYSAYQIHLQKSTALAGVVQWVLITVVCVATAFGLVILNEKIAPGAYANAQEKTIRKLVDKARSGDKAKACELVYLEDAASDEYFPLCKEYLESLQGSPALWSELQNFTIGASFRSQKSGRSVIPPEFQSWFLNLFFDQMMKAAPSDLKAKIATGPDEHWGDLLSLGNLLLSLSKNNAWDKTVVQGFVQNTLPLIELHFKNRFSEADKIALSLKIKDGFVDQSDKDYSRQKESSYRYAAWARDGIAQVKAYAAVK